MGLRRAEHLTAGFIEIGSPTLLGAGAGILVARHTADTSELLRHGG